MLVRVTSTVLGMLPGDVLELTDEEAEKAAPYLAGKHLVRIREDDVDDAPVRRLESDVAMAAPADVEGAVERLVAALATGQVDEALRERDLPVSGKVADRRARLVEAMLEERSPAGEG